MKKIIKMLSMLVLVCLVGIILGSCNNDQNNENPTTYKVTFYAGNSEDDEVLKQVEVESGQTVEEWTPANKEDGSTFVGWYATPSLTHEFDFSTPITKDTSVFSMWASQQEDNRTWEIVGNLTGELAGSNWGNGNYGKDVFKLEKVEGKPNVFEGTFELTQNNKFQFAVLEFNEEHTTSEWVAQMGGGLLDQGDNEWFETEDNYLDPQAWKSNIAVLVSGEYKFTLTTDQTTPEAGVINVERIGDIEEDVTPFEPFIGGSLTHGQHTTKADNPDLFFPMGELVGDNIVWTGEFNFNAGERINILMVVNDWNVQLNQQHNVLDKESTDALNVNINSANEIEIINSGKYEVVITANKDVASVISEDVIGANLDTYNNYESYSVKLTRVGDFEKTEGIVYNTYNVKYNGKGDDYTVYVRNGAQFPTIKNPTLADGETLVGWYYEVEEEKVGLGYEVVLEAANVTYDLNYEVITASSTTNDPRRFWIKGDSTATLDGTTVSWANQTHYLKQTSAYTYEGTLVVNGAFKFQIVSDLYGVNQSIYYRTGAVENPGDFIDKTSAADIKITESGTYKLVFNSLTGKVTITVAE